MKRAGNRTGREAKKRRRRHERRVAWNQYKQGQRLHAALVRALENAGGVIDMGMRPWPHGDDVPMFQIGFL